jgi:hypothetical protein
MGVKTFEVHIECYEDGEPIITHDNYDAETPLEAEMDAAEDYPGSRVSATCGCGR